MRVERISREELIRRYESTEAVTDDLDNIELTTRDGKRVNAGALERERFAWASRLVGQHLGPALEALWQAAMAQRDWGVRT